MSEKPEIKINNNDPLKESNNGGKQENERRKTFSYNTDVVKEEILKIIKEKEFIKEVKYLNINGVGDKIELKIEIVAKKGMEMTVKIDAKLININGKISIENTPKINAGMSTIVVKKLIKPFLGQISEKIKEFIEKIENKKIEKIWIEDGQLKAQ